ncbi:MAG: N utilization substance protein A [Parcubacteria group bacterium Licking1014_17]|nr:MAG: N utilization substance protein A [Parcubacteria group bacterium Licking1014_17]
MLDVKQFLSAVGQIAEEKGISQDKVIDTIQDAIAAAYKRDYGERSQIIKVKINPETGDFDVKQVKIVVEGTDEEGYVIGGVPVTEEDKKELTIREARTDKNFGASAESEKEGNPEEGEAVKVKFNPEKYIVLEDAKKIKEDAKVGDQIVFNLEKKSDFGRIAAQTAKQVIIQRLREIERDAIFLEFKDKEGMVLSGIIQRVESRVVYVDLGRTNGLLMPTDQMPNDNYRIGQRLRFIILRVDQTNKGPVIILSRSSPDLVAKLFEFEVPEIESGSVEIKDVAREAGSRSKVAVMSNDDGIDPIGSLVGQKGVRVQTIINELNGEKIDIIEWNENPEVFVSHALSPAKIMKVSVLDADKKHALAEVADDQFSLAIGKRGQNVRLAAKLTGWKIDVRAPQSNMLAEEAIKEEEPAPALADDAKVKDETGKKPEEK